MLGSHYGKQRRVHRECTLQGVQVVSHSLPRDVGLGCFHTGMGNE